MQAKEKFQRNMEKVERKLAFISRALNYNLTQDQQEWLRSQSTLFTSLYETLRGTAPADEYGEGVSEDLYNNIRRVKQKVIYWLKLDSTDVNIFKKLRKEKNATWIPLIDIIPAPERLTEFRSADLWDLSFPCISYTNQELCEFSEMIFKDQNVLSEFQISSDTLNKIIKMICFEYNTPPYHNYSHGFNVFQMFYSLVKKTELEKVLDKTEIFAALLASLGHDLNHKGVNNAFESKLKTKNSILYFDNAILESMHASFLIRILKDPEINFLESISDLPKRNQFKDILVSVILATDMSKHNKLLQKFTDGVKATVEYRTVKASGQPIDKRLEEKAFLMERPQDKRRILKNIIHACDIGNPCQKYDRYIYWSALVNHEFDNQTKKEAKKGLEVTTFMKYKDLPSFYNSQIFFAKNVTFPLWEQISILFPGASEAVENLQENLKRLEEEKVKANPM